VMGPSGSGKSTLLHCLAGLDSVDAGTVRLGGTDLSGLDERQLTRLRRDRVGFIFQSFNLLPTLTAAENITLPQTIARRTPDRAWLDRVVQAVGVADRLTHRPAELSGGQQQRVAAARALAGGPAVVFADYRLPVPDQTFAAHPGLERFLDRRVIVGLRPSSLEDAAFAPKGWPQIKAEAGVTEKLGSEVDVIFPVKIPPVQHEVLIAQFDKAAKDKEPTGHEQDRTGGSDQDGERGSRERQPGEPEDAGQAPDHPRHLEEQGDIHHQPEPQQP